MRKHEHNPLSWDEKIESTYLLVSKYLSSLEIRFSFLNKCTHSFLSISLQQFLWYYLDNIIFASSICDAETLRPTVPNVWWKNRFSNLSPSSSGISNAATIKLKLRINEEEELKECDHTHMRWQPPSPSSWSPSSGSRSSPPFWGLRPPIAQEERFC